jgi:hypothetical protein
METRINDKFSYIFNRNKGVGTLLFSLKRNEVLNLLGEPDSVDNDVYEKNVEETIRFHYKKKGIMISFSRYDGVFDPLKIYLQKLNIEGSNIYNLNYIYVKEYLQSFHQKKQITFKLEETNDGAEQIIFYPNIGLTLWYENRNLIDLCVEKIQ